MNYIQQKNEQRGLYTSTWNIPMTTKKKTDREKRNSEKHKDIFSIFTDGYLSKKIESEVKFILNNMESEQDSIIKNNLVAIRRTFESVFQKLFKTGVIWRDCAVGKNINIRKSFWHLKGRFDNNTKCNNGEIYCEHNGIIDKFSDTIYSITSDAGAHNPLADLGYQPSSYTVISLTYELMDILLWFKRIMSKVSIRKY